MAKAKKGKLCIEEMLVSTDLQPYEIPKNWCWIHLLESFDNVTDSKKKLSTKEYLEEGEYPIIDQGQEYIGGYTDDEGMIYDGKLPIVIFGDHTRCIKYIDFQFAQGADGVKVLKPKQFWDSKAFYYAMQSVEIPNMGYRRHYPLFKDFCIPVPPLAEQKRIVEQIESLFSKLDEAKDKAQEVLDEFESRKAAVLHKALSGELTKKWRLDKGINDNRKTVPLSKCCKIGSGGTPSRKIPEYYDGNIPWIKTGEINWNDIGDAEEHISQEAIDNSSAKIYKPGAVLVAMYGMGITRGRAAILKKEAATNQAVCVLQPNSDLYNKYLFYYFMCNYWEIREKSVGGNQLNLSGTIIGQFVIDIPSFEEQQRVVTILDDIFKREMKVKEFLETILEQIDLMKKSILAKAFHGKLGTNISEEENSIELLKKIIEEG